MCHRQGPWLAPQLPPLRDEERERWALPTPVPRRPLANPSDGSAASRVLHDQLSPQTTSVPGIQTTEIRKRSCLIHGQEHDPDPVQPLNHPWQPSQNNYTSTQRHPYLGQPPHHHWRKLLSKPQSTPSLKKDHPPERPVDHQANQHLIQRWQNWRLPCRLALWCCPHTPQDCPHQSHQI